MPSHQFHLSLNCSNLSHSVGFYRLLFGQEPAKWFPDYAKFELTDPPLVLALEPAHSTQPGTLNHLGLRVADAAAVEAYESRLRQAGVTTQRLNDIECCYSRQSKIVFRDPDQNLIEVYVLEGESDQKASRESAARVEAAKEATHRWEHLVGTPLHLPEPGDRRRYAEVAFRGTFNRESEFERIDTILKEARTALQPGGQLLIHLLVSDRPVTQAVPILPPPADLVRYIPTETAMIEAIERAGFAHLELIRLSHSPVMRLGDAELREFLLHAKNLMDIPASLRREVVYKGPFTQVQDDRGRVFTRGRRVALSDDEVTWLDEQGWLVDFVILNSETSGC